MRISALAAIAALTLPALPAAAAVVPPPNRVFATAGGCDQRTTQGPITGNSASASVSAELGTASCGVSVEVGAGFIAAEGGTVVGPVPPGVNFGTQPQIEANATFNFSIDTPDGFEGGLIDVTANADLSAILNISATREGGVGAVQLLDATLSALTGGSGGGNALDTDSFRYEYNDFASGGTVGDVAIIDEMLSTTLSLDPTQKYISIGFSLFISQSIDTRPGGSGTFGFDAADTFSFAQTAFELPEGFSITSLEASVVDNAWIDPRFSQEPGPAPSPIPLPAGGLLLIGGLAAFGAIRRKPPQ